MRVACPGCPCESTMVGAYVWEEDHAAQRDPAAPYPLALPSYPENAPFLGIAEIEFAMIGVVKCLPDAASQMGVGSGNPDPLSFLLDIDDPLQGVFCSGPTLLIARQVENFCLPFLEKWTA